MPADIKMAENAITAIIKKATEEKTVFTFGHEGTDGRSFQESRIS